MSFIRNPRGSHSRDRTYAIPFPLHKSHGDLSTRHSLSYIFPAMISLLVSSTTIPPTQLESPRHAKDLEDCRKTCLNVVSCNIVHDC